MQRLHYLWFFVHSQASTPTTARKSALAGRKNQPVVKTSPDALSRMAPCKPPITPWAAGRSATCGLRARPSSISASPPRIVRKSTMSCDGSRHPIQPAATRSQAGRLPEVALDQVPPFVGFLVEFRGEAPVRFRRDNSNYSRGAPHHRKPFRLMKIMPLRIGLVLGKESAKSRHLRFAQPEQVAHGSGFLAEPESRLGCEISGSGV